MTESLTLTKFQEANTKVVSLGHRLSEAKESRDKVMTARREVALEMAVNGSHPKAQARLADLDKDLADATALVEGIEELLVQAQADLKQATDAHESERKGAELRRKAERLCEVESLLRGQLANMTEKYGAFAEALAVVFASQEELAHLPGGHDCWQSIRLYLASSIGGPVVELKKKGWTNAAGWFEVYAMRPPKAR